MEVFRGFPLEGQGPICACVLEAAGPRPLEWSCLCSEAMEDRPLGLQNGDEMSPVVQGGSHSGHGQNIRKQRPHLVDRQVPWPLRSLPEVDGPM